MAAHPARGERRTTNHWEVTSHAEGDAESPGSGGASPYLRRGYRVNLRYNYKLTAYGVNPGENGAKIRTIWDVSSSRRT
jgi:hypothetical protein